MLTAFFYVAAFAASALVQQPPSATTTAMLTPYLEVQAHLAADRFEAIKAPAASLASQAAAAGKSGEGIARAAAALQKAQDIEAAREAFGPLSDAVIAHLKAEGVNPADVRLGFCPMVKRAWLQQGDQVRNPYYGSAMLTCGELTPLK
jgi:Cu(I)/Ag(I) efflux system membrane fusion protein